MKCQLDINTINEKRNHKGCSVSTVIKCKVCGDELWNPISMAETKSMGLINIPELIPECPGPKVKDAT